MLGCRRPSTWRWWALCIYNFDRYPVVSIIIRSSSSQLDSKRKTPWMCLRQMIWSIYARWRAKKTHGHCRNASTAPKNVEDLNGWNRFCALDKTFIRKQYKQICYRPTTSSMPFQQGLYRLRDTSIDWILNGTMKSQTYSLMCKLHLFCCAVIGSLKETVAVKLYLADAGKVAGRAANREYVGKGWTPVSQWSGLSGRTVKGAILVVEDIVAWSRLEMVGSTEEIK